MEGEAHCRDFEGKYVGRWIKGGNRVVLKIDEFCFKSRKGSMFNNVAKCTIMTGEHKGEKYEFVVSTQFRFEVELWLRNLYDDFNIALLRL